jgi:hypothetical protein
MGVKRHFHLSRASYDWDDGEVVAILEDDLERAEAMMQCIERPLPLLQRWRGGIMRSDERWSLSCP